MRRHQNQEIREAIEYALKHGWSVKKSKGYAWGILYCPHNDSNCRGGIHCRISIYTTPQNPSNTARKLKRIVRNCNYFDG